MSQDSLPSGAAGAGTLTSWLSLICRLAVGQVFIFAGLMKVVDPQSVANSIITFDVISKENETLISLAAHIIPWTEIIAGTLLVTGLFTRASASVVFLMLAGFIGLVAHALQQDQPVICSCFGKVKLLCEAQITTCNYIQNGILALLALIPILIGGGRASADALMSPRPEPNYDDYGQEEDDEVFD